MDTAVQFFINLTDGGKPYKMEEGCTARLFGKKADGTSLVNDCDIIDNGTRIHYQFNEQTASVLGVCECELRLGNTGRGLTTPSFDILVVPRVLKDDEIIESEAEKSAIDNLFLSENERVIAEEARVKAEKLRDENFSAMYVRYSNYPDGRDSSETYVEGMCYIGLASGKVAPEDNNGYTWCKFISDNKKFLEGEGTLELEIEDSTIFYINGYDTVSLIAPATTRYTSHLFITFPKTAEKANLIVPSGTLAFGANPSTASPGDTWEVSIDGIGGAVCAVHKGG
jgi:hypothetical protein